MGIALAQSPLEGLATLLLHGLAATGLSRAVAARVPAAQRSRHLGWALLAVALFLPGFGPLALAVLCVFARFGASAPPPAWWRCELPPLPPSPGTPLAHRVEPEALSVLSRSRDFDRRRRAVLLARRLSPERAAPLLLTAVKDEADELRLLGYALADAMERELYGAVAEDQRRLEEDPDNADAHFRVAARYAELVRLGLAQGDAAQQALERAAGHARRSTRLDEASAAAPLLLARVSLRVGALGEAGWALGAAEARGMPVETVGPLRAELAFRRRALGDLEATVARFSPALRLRPRVREVARYWTGGGVALSAIRPNDPES